MKKQKLQDEYNPHLKEAILQVVDNQIAGIDEDGEPLTTTTDEPNYVKDNFDRLSTVHGPDKAKEMIAAVLAEEMFNALKYDKMFDESRYKARLEKLEGKFIMEENKNGGLSKETNGLLRSYFDAFSHLYGITPLYRALRIIRKQNPELELTEEDFLSFVDEIEQEFQNYMIAGEEDIYCDVTEPTPPLKREIIAEHLYAVDDFDSYDELRAQQEGKPFYVPEKEELLKYQEDCYVEETKESLALGAFLRDKLKLKRADDVLENLQLVARMGDSDPQWIIYEVERMAGKGCLGTVEQVSEFFRYYFAMYNNTRIASNRGFTPNELSVRMDRPPHSIEFGPNISRSLQTGEMDLGELRQGIFGSDIPAPWKVSMLNDLERVEQKKPGRNDPCPCGSGKKYKRCCGR